MKKTKVRSMIESAVHNPDRYMMDLRQVLSQGRKRIGLFIGAGAPVSILVNDKNELDANGDSIIPAVKGLTKSVLEKLDSSEIEVIGKLFSGTENYNIEDILTKIRRLSQAIGCEKIHGYDGAEFDKVAENICSEIGKIVAAQLPNGTTSFSELVSWIGGIDRIYPIEIFTPNYDLLIEEAFERARLPYFDGFSGSFKPFFEASSINGDLLPARWSRLWKIHGSLGWDIDGDSITRTGDRNATSLIYPEHLKYEHISRQPFSALFERLRNFLCCPDTLLLATGFSFEDAHIASVFEETLSTNSHVSIIAFQHSPLTEESPAVQLALKRPNLSVFGPDSAVIAGVLGKWSLGKAPSDEWVNIRKTYWSTENSTSCFTLGNFAALARFIALSKSQDLSELPTLGESQEVEKSDPIDENEVSEVVEQ